MSAQNDGVLKVLHNACLGIAARHELYQAHDAVRELVEAAREFKDRNTYKSEDRLSAALERFGGAK